MALIVPKPRKLGCHYLSTTCNHSPSTLTIWDCNLLHTSCHRFLSIVGVQPEGAYAAYEPEQLRTRYRQANPTTRKKPSQTPGATRSNLSRDYSCYHGMGFQRVALWCQSIAQEWHSAPRPVAISSRLSSSGGGLFGRPVILWIRGASYLL